MTEDEVRDAVDGLYAYDSGCVSSGIKDERLRRRLYEYLRGLDGSARRMLLGRVVRSLSLDDAMLAKGYGPEDAMRICLWLDEQGMLL